MASAKLIESQKFTLDGGATVQIRIWRLPKPTVERPHGLKYSLFYGRDGQRIIAYDNETGKAITVTIGIAKNVTSTRRSRHLFRIFGGM
jgi:Family of unknown function (DUF6516)